MGESFSVMQSLSSSLLSYLSDANSSVFSGKHSLVHAGNPAIGNRKAFPCLSFCLTLDGICTLLPADPRFLEEYISVDGGRVRPSSYMAESSHLESTGPLDELKKA